MVGDTSAEETVVGEPAAEEAAEEPATEEAAVEELVAEAESFYFDLLRSQTSAEQSILKAVGREGVVESISGRDFIDRNKLPAASTVRSAAAKLTERDLLYRTDAGYVVYDRFFGIWLKRL